MVDWLLVDTGGSADTQRCDRDRDRLLAARQDVVQTLELRPPGLHVLEVLSPLRYAMPESAVYHKRVRTCQLQVMVQLSSMKLATLIGCMQC